MIQTPTTLILGAGASAPFGFPTGYELVSRVIEYITPKELVPNYKVLEYRRLFNSLGHDDEAIEKFKDALSKSGKTSVDAFLEHRPEFIPIGKAVMATALIQCENEQNLFKRDGKSWYEYLFNQLNAQFEDFGQNQLKILTFNYDRSLERFLFTALKNSSGKSDDECLGKLKTIPIIHLHGDLGALSNTGIASARPYDTSITLEALNIATKRIKIIHEGIANDLRIDYPKASEKIIGSLYGMTDAESDQIDLRYGLNLKYAFDPNRYCAPFEVFQYLRESGVLH